MATIRIKEVFELGLENEHDATSYQVATDVDYDHKLLDVVKDRVNLLELRTVLRNDDGTLFEFNVPVYARVKLHYRDYDTAWFDVGTCMRGNNVEEIENTEY